MSSLRSLAFILCSAMRRARAFSCASLEIIDEKRQRKKATNNPKKMATNTPICTPIDTLYKAITARGARVFAPFGTYYRASTTEDIESTEKCF